MQNPDNNYPTSYYEDLKARADIKAIARELGIEINHRNQAKCFNGHDNKTDSLTFYDDHAHCYGCGFHGDVITLVEKVRGVDHREARNWLADQVGMPHLTTLNYSPQQIQKYEEERAEKKLIWDILTEAASYYHQILLQDKEMYEYLQDHYGFSEETIFELKLGYSTGNGLGKHLISKGYSVDDILKTGLFIKSEGRHIEFYNHRLIFPYWKSGRVVYMTGRQTSRTPNTGYEQGKYKKLLTRNEKRPYISEFIKNEYFYNEDGIKGTEEALLIEGVTDVIAAMQAGFKNSISPVTVRFRREDFAKLERLLANIATVYLVNDNEENQSGLKGALETAEFSEGLGKRAYPVILPRPEGKNKIDLNEYLRDHQKEDLQKLMDEALTPLQFEITQIASQGLADIKLADALKPIVMKLAALDKATAEGYLAYIKKTLAVKADFIRALKQDIQNVKKEIKNYSVPYGQRSLRSLRSLRPPVAFIEVIKTKEGLKYWLANGEIKNSVDVEGTIYEPPPQVDLVTLPTEKALEFVNSDNSNLFNEVKQFIHDHLDLEKDFGYEILTLWVFHSWLIDKFNTSPIIHFLGPYASGKSRAGDVLSILAKRGLCTVNLTGAPIFRVGELYEPTFIIDEIKLTGRDKNRDILELLNARFQRGRQVIRINPDKTGLDSILKFKVYGATVLCGLDELPETPRSRAIIFIMEQNVRPVKEHLNLERAKILRDRLCAFRARHLINEMPKVERFVRDGRLADAIEPLHQIVGLINPELEEDFKAFFKKIEQENLEETFDSFDADVVRALLECRDEVEQGRILACHIIEAFNKKRSEPEKVDGRTIGKALTRLGFKKVRTTGGAKARFWNEKKIKRLQKRFGISDQSDQRDQSDLYLEGEAEKKYTFENDEPLTIPLED